MAPPPKLATDHIAAPLSPQLLVHASPPPSASTGGRRRARAAAAAASSSAVKTTEGENVYTLTLDASCLKTIQSLRSLTESLKAPRGGKKGELVAKRWCFHSERPNWKSDIQWVSSADEATFWGLFEPLFEKLAIAAHFRFLGCEMVLFSGFFVLRQNTRKSHFHKDFGDTGGRAFTLMTPLVDMSALPDCHLACRVPPPLPSSSATAEATARRRLGPAEADASGGAAEAEPGDGTVAADVMPTAPPPAAFVTKQYRYRVGEAIVFGDGFEHATEVGASPHPLAFLCFTFGDRRCTAEQWRAAEAYISEQGPVYQDPHGRLQGSAMPMVSPVAVT